MKYKTTVRTLRRNGYTVVDDGNHCTARRVQSGARIEVSRSNENDASIRVISDGDEDDVRSDYCAGYWFDTVKGAMRASIVARQPKSRRRN